MVMPYLRDMINDHKTAENKSMRVSFICSRDTGETCTIYVMSDNENIMWGSETDNIIK